MKVTWSVLFLAPTYTKGFKRKPQYDIIEQVYSTRQDAVWIVKECLEAGNAFYPLVAIASDDSEILGAAEILYELGAPLPTVCKDHGAPYCECRETA